MGHTFRLLGLTAPGSADPSIALAVTRAGGLGILDLEYVVDAETASSALTRLTAQARAAVGVKLDGTDEGLIAKVAADHLPHLTTVVLVPTAPAALAEQIALLRAAGLTVLVETTTAAEAALAAAEGADGLIAKGNEAAGRVGMESTFVLLQRLIATYPSTPIYAQGGIGLHSAAACLAAGAAGVVLDGQLALVRESAYPRDIQTRISRMDGSETTTVGLECGAEHRIYSQPGLRPVEDLRRAESQLTAQPPTEEGANLARRWRAEVKGRANGAPDLERGVLPLGQDAAFAAPLARRYRTAAGIMQAIRTAATTACRAAAELRPLDEGSPLALAHGTRYPIAQGPMTRVSDTAPFCSAVAEGGALPFLALALLRGPEVQALLEETERLLGDRSWGVGILGFVPLELRQEQIEVVRRFRPPFAVIAGGRPDQARALEDDGITSYLHVPSPGLLKMFIGNGARRFVFEGRECGGHVGPRSSFVLWDLMIDVLLEATAESGIAGEEFHILFAGGVHDALSASMVAAMAAPLAQRGIKIGVLMGTAYLFTEEAVAGGAIMPAFQQEAVRCAETVLLMSGPGHSIRCVDTSFVDVFAQERRRLLQEGRSADEVKEALEEFNLGRLRLASKGLTRNPQRDHTPDAPRLVSVDEQTQRRDGMYMIGQVAALRQQVLTVADLHHDVAVEGSARLAALPDEVVTDEPVTPSLDDPSDIAIVGMSCLLPKAGSLDSYWQNILDKVDAVTEIPTERWDWRRYFDADRKKRDKVYSKWGGFLDDVAFNPLDYGMPPTTIPSIEPVQLLMLHATRAALADAGYLDREFARERTSVILGASASGELGENLAFRTLLPSFFDGMDQPGNPLSDLADALPEWTEDSFPGILMNVAAGRIANRFNLGGSNYTVDAACASSLAAVHLAVRDLETGASDMVICGGADPLMSPFTYFCFSKTQALSPRGRCHTFDASADGIAIAEGVGVVVLKRLADAERDGDRVYAVIKGTASSSDGRDKGLTAPRPEGQVRALKRAYAKAGFSPATVGLIEAHGTGTVAGDQSEVTSLTRVFAEAGAQPQSTAIGSVKSMIGHTKCTAGVASLIKMALALHHKVLPATLHVQTPNPRADFPSTPFFVNTETRPWVASPDQPRRAGINAFGFGGTNFHAVLEEHTPTTLPADAVAQEWDSELFVWRKESRADLSTALGTLATALSGHSQPALRDLAYTVTTQAGGSAALTLAIVAASRDDLRAKVDAAAKALSDPATDKINDPRGIYFTSAPLGREGKVAFLFPGQGSQSVDMLRELTLHFAEVRTAFEEAAALDGRRPKPLASYVFAPSAFDDEARAAQQKELTRTAIAQPALGAADVGAFRLLTALGITPEMTAGHSYGEFVALHAAGVYDAATLVQLSEARGRFMQEASGADAGTMAAVEAGPAQIGDVLRAADATLAAQIVLANMNTPRQTVISGPRAAIEQAVALFGERSIRAKLLPVSCAFHSPLVAPAQARLAEVLATVSFRSPRLTVYANTTAAPYPDDATQAAALLARHLTSPVEFVRQTEAMYEAGARIFVEVGPRNVLTGLSDATLNGRPHLSVALDQPGRGGLLGLHHLLAQLAVQGLPLKLSRLYQGREVTTLNLAALATAQAPVLPPTTWLVNGSRAIPATGAAQRGVRTLLPPLLAVRAGQDTSALTALPAPTARDTTAAPPPPSQAIETPRRRREEPMDTSLSPLSATASDAGVDAVMLRFQGLMSGFLETQQHVMLQYLAAVPQAAPHGALPVIDAPAAATALSPTIVPQLPAPVITTVTAVTETLSLAPPAANHQASPASVAPPLSRSETVPAAVPPATPVAVAAVAHTSGLGQAELTTRLLAVVSERTGYPSEMLDLDADLEADLGIDSIKRVEIMGTLHTHLAERLNGNTPAAMEQLTALKTLRGIVTALHASLHDAGPPVAPAVATAVLDAPPAAVAHTSGLGQAELTTRLLAVVSERTGYPSEMLDLDADLEADLGIDSIKRVEIMGTLHTHLAERLNGNTPAAMEQLTALKTLRGIVTALHASLNLPHVDDVAPAVEQGLTEDPRDPDPDPDSDPAGGPVPRFNDLITIDAPLGPSVTLPRDRVVLLTDDERGVASALAGQLAEQGYAVALVRCRTARQTHTVAGTLDVRVQPYIADLSTPSGVEQLLHEVRGQQGPLGAVVHLLPLRKGAAFDQLDVVAWQARLATEVKGLFYLTRGAAEDLRAVPGRASCLLSVTGLGGTFSTGSLPPPDLSFPGNGGCVGLIKTVALEWPDVRVRAVDLDSHGAPTTLAGHILTELHADDREAEVGYRGDQRITLRPWLAAVDCTSPPAMQIDASWVILITGGARGITAEVAHELAQRYKPTLLLAGRSALPAAEYAATVGLTAPNEIKAALIAQARAAGGTVTPRAIEDAYKRLIYDREIRATMARLHETGATVRYYAVDVRDAAALTALVESVYADYDRLDMVVHGAGVIEDKLAADKTTESFDRVFETKAHSIFTLARALRPESLRCLALFSSMAARFGNRGQGDYTAANEVLNKLAIELDSRWPGRVVAFNWGPWASGTMVTPEVRAQFAQRGVELIEPAMGRRRFIEELLYGRKGEVEVVLGGGTWLAQADEVQQAVTLSRQASSPAAPRAGLPLLRADQAVVRLPDGGVEVTYRLDAARDLYLIDHCLDGQAVLPFAMAHELMAEVAAWGWPELQVARVTGTRLFQGIVLEPLADDEPASAQDMQARFSSRDLRVTARPRTGAAASGTQDIEVSISTALPDQAAAARQRMHYRCTVTLMRDLPAAPVYAPPPLTNAGAFPLSVTDAYRQWLFHGPRMAGIAAIDAVGDLGLSVSLIPSSPQRVLDDAAPGAWQIDPIVIDSGLQVMLLWSRRTLDMTGLPAHLDTYHRFGSLADPRLRLEHRVYPEASTGPLIRSDIAFLGSDGRLLGLMQNMECTVSKALNRLTDKPAHV